MTDVNGAEPANMDIFNFVAREIFVQLYENFPNPTTISRQRLAEKILGDERYWRAEDLREEGSRTETVEGDRYKRIARNSIEWLPQHRFIIQEHEQEYRLSPKAFEVLDATPTSLRTDEAKPLGKQLASATATVGDRATTAVISEMVGQVIGAAARSLFS
jgi:hypothetical protein